MRKLSALTATLLLAISTPALADTYPIQCNRLYKTGESYNIHHTYELTVDAVGGMVTKTPKTDSKTTKGEITARVSNVHADPAKNSETFTLTITHLINGVTKRDCIRPGTVLNVTLTPTRVIFEPTTGGPIPDNAKSLLLFLFPVTGSTTKSIVDSYDPQTLGDKWKIDPMATTEYFKTSHLLINPSSIEGQATLAKVDDTAKTLRITADVRAKDFTTDLLPARATVDKSDMTVTYNLLAPIDTASPLLENSLTCDATLHINSVTSTILIDEKLHLVVQRTTTPIPTATAKAQ